MALIAAARKWAQEEVYPKVRTLPPDVLEGLPRAEPSAMEGAGSEDVIGAFLDNFEVQAFDSRYITLDAFSFMYYLSRLPDRTGYDYAGNVIHHIYRFLMDAFPNGAEYAILIGRKGNGSEQPPANELAEGARSLSEGQTGLVRRQLQDAQHELAQARAVLQEQDSIIIAKNRHIEEIERWAHSLEHDLQAARAGLPTRARRKLSRLIGRKP
jgi:hypothetical protein